VISSPGFSYHVKTVVSVDGAQPDIEAAEKHGLKYVHCHHGKHRGPAAAAVVCIASGASDGKEVLEILKRAGTSENYPGLWRDVEAFTKPASDEELPELVSVADVGSMVAAMAKIDRAHDNLKLFVAADWGILQDRRDLVATREAKKVKEGFEASLENLADGSDEQLKTWMGESLSKADALETALQSQDTAQATQHFGALQKACKTCHADYRN
jgi:cytochrome c556